MAEDQIMMAIDDFSDGFIVFDEGLSFRYMNSAAESAFGCRREEVLGKRFLEAFPATRPSVFDDAFARCLVDRRSQDFQTFFGAGGKARWYGILVSPAGTGVSVRLRALEDGGEAAEKDRIVSELGHRVKNSLSVIASLASLAIGSIEDKAARQIVEVLLGRIHAASLLYDKLSRARGPDSIDVAEYLSELASLVAANFSDRKGRVKVELALSNLELDSARAAALGLAANEAMTNSFKYAFGGTGEGRLRIELSSSRGRVEFTVEDDGPGFPAGFDPLKDGDIGYALMADKARELRGQLTVSCGAGGRGARVQISFPA